jgi:hypothetical protein
MAVPKAKKLKIICEKLEKAKYFPSGIISD